MSNVPVYGFCENNCRFLVYTREEVLSLLQQAINDGSLQNIDIDAAAVAKIKSDNGGADISFWTGTEAEFNALDPKPSVAYFIPRRDADGKIYICIDDSHFATMPTTPLSAEDIAAICV